MASHTDKKTFIEEIENLYNERPNNDPSVKLERIKIQQTDSRWGVSYVVSIGDISVTGDKYMDAFQTLYSILTYKRE